MKVDHHDPLRHPYQLIADDLRSRISKAEFATGQALPSVKALAVEYEAAPSTIQNAMRILKDTGLVVSAPNRGFYVRDPSQPERFGGRADQEQLAAALSDLRVLQERVTALEAENADLRTRTVALETRRTDHPL